MKRRYKLNKWGKSARVSIPLHIWKELKWSQDDKVVYDIKDGELIITVKRD